MNSKEAKEPVDHFFCLVRKIFESVAYGSEIFATVDLPRRVFLGGRNCRPCVKTKRLCKNPEREKRSRKSKNENERTQKGEGKIVETVMRVGNARGGRVKRSG